jgi:hypothetical protein
VAHIDLAYAGGAAYQKRLLGLLELALRACGGLETSLAYERRLIGQTAARRRDQAFPPRTLNNRHRRFRGPEPQPQARRNPALAGGRRCM